MAVASVATLVGTSMAIAPRESLAELAEDFDLSKVSSGPARFEPKQIADFSAQMVHTLEPADVAGTLSDIGVPTDLQADFWLAVRKNCNAPQDAEAWWQMLNAQSVESNLENDDVAYIQTALTKLPDGAITSGNLGRLDGRAEGRDRPQGQGAFHAAAQGTHRHGTRSGNGPDHRSAWSRQNRRSSGTSGRLVATNGPFVATISWKNIHSRVQPGEPSARHPVRGA
jgi:hypothetical protein